MTRRYQRLVKEGEQAGDPDLHSAEVRVYADFLRIVLEILNCIVTSRLQENPELVYALLHRQDIFVSFRVLSLLLAHVQWKFHALCMCENFGRKRRAGPGVRGWGWLKSRSKARVWAVSCGFMCVYFHAFLFLARFEHCCCVGFPEVTLTVTDGSLTCCEYRQVLQTRGSLVFTLDRAATSHAHVWLPQVLPRFSELVNNIELVINFFNQRVDAARESKGGTWNVERVLDCIKGTFVNKPCNARIQAHHSEGIFRVLCCLKNPRHVYCLLFFL